MFYYAVKILVSSILIVVISEISKKYSMLGGIIASLPLLSILAMVWLYVETEDIQKVSSLSTSVFWFVIPSLALFISLPILLKNGLGFYLSLFISSCITIGCYYLMLFILTHYGIKIEN